MKHLLLTLTLLTSLLWGNETARFSAKRILNGTELERELLAAKKNGALIVLDLSDTEITKKYRERLWALIPTSVDILFANADEAFAFTNLPPKQAAVFLKNFCRTAIITTGEEGCWVCSDQGLLHSPGIKTIVVDPAGAGEQFINGFLYAYQKNEPLERCAFMGNLAGSAAVGQESSEFSKAQWTEILHIFEISDCKQTDSPL